GRCRPPPRTWPTARSPRLRRRWECGARPWSGASAGSLLSLCRPWLASCRSGPRRDLEEALDESLGELRLVDVQGQADDPALGGRLHGRLERFQQGGIRGRIAEGLSRRIDRGDALLGNEEAYRPAAGVELVPDPLADLAALVRRGAQQRHLGVVPVEIAAAKLRRHRLQGPEVDHVE